MASVEIVPCTLKHIRELGIHLRPGDYAELAATGLRIRHVLYDIWLRSANPRCGLVDGKVAACWGLTNSLLLTEGEPWLFTTPEVEKVPVRFVKQARHELKIMLRDHHSLVTSVACDYTKAIRFLGALGFSLGAEFQQGPDQKSFRLIHMER